MWQQKYFLILTYLEFLVCITLKESQIIALFLFIKDLCMHNLETTNAVVIQTYSELSLCVTACAAGTYALPGATSCQPCPENSHSERAAPFCPCSENYVRSDPSDVTLPCKRKAIL